jgi:hypothetical protein
VIKMPRPPVKATRRVAEAQEAGILDAREKARRKHLKWNIKSLMESAREHVGKLIDTLTFRDIIDIVAAIGLAPVIRSVIADLPAIKNSLTTVFLAPGVYVAGIFFPGLQNIANQALDLIGKFFSGTLGQPPPTVQATAGSPQAEDIMLWILSFAVAWMIVKFGDKLINAGITGLSGIVGLLTATA